MIYGGVYEEGVTEFSVLNNYYYIKPHIHNGTLRVIAVDKFGERVTCGNLAWFDNEGVHLNSAVTPQLGMKLTPRGHIIAHRGY